MFNSEEHNQNTNLACSLQMNYALESKILQSFKMLNVHTAQTLKREVSMNGKYGKKYKKPKPNTHTHQD